MAKLKLKTKNVTIMFKLTLFIKKIIKFSCLNKTKTSSDP